MENSNEISQMIDLLKTQIDSQNKIITHLQNERDVASQVDDEEENSISIIDLVVSVLKGWWLILIFTFIGAAGTLAYNMVGYVPTYTATGKMYVNNSSINIGASNISISNGDLSASQSLVKTYSVILKTHLVLDQVGIDLKNNGFEGYDYDSMIDNIKCGQIDSTEVFYISYSDNDPKAAISVVNTIINDLPRQLSLVIEGSSARTVDKAKVAVRDSTGFATKTLIGALVGFVAAAGISFCYYYLLNDKLNGSDWLRDRYPNIPVLGEVPDILLPNKNGYYKYKKYSRYKYIKDYESHKEDKEVK